MSEEPQGKLLGVPYDFRRPTKAKIKSRWWNDDDPRFFPPHAFGIGWATNFATVARKLRLRR